LRRHAIEFIGEHFDFIAGFEIQPVAEIAGGDALDALAQYAHRLHDPARQEKTRDQRHAETD
jgi:hypothetical protein